MKPMAMKAKTRGGVFPGSNGPLSFPLLLFVDPASGDGDVEE